MAEVSLNFPVGLPEPTLLAVSAKGVSAIPDLSAREEAVQTLFKLVHGVLGAPEDPKKRRLKKQNEVFNRKVGRHEAAVNFLRACGFADSDDPETPGDAGRSALLYMQTAFITRLTDAHHTLTALAQEIGVAAPPMPTSGSVFNPYSSHSQSSDSTSRAPKAPTAYGNECQRVHNEIKTIETDLKQKVLEAPPVPLNPSAFWQATGRRLEEVIKELSVSGEGEETAGDNQLLASQLEATNKALQGAGEKFQNAEKRRLVELQRKRVHATCILRIIFPDKSVLQVSFRAADTGAYVTEQIAPLLSPGTRAASWYLYQSPPMRRLSPKETLQAAGFSPGANMYMGFEGAKPTAPFLEASLVQQLGPAPTPAAGVTGHSFTGEAMGWGVGQKLGGPAAGGGSGGGSPAPSAPLPNASGTNPDSSN